MQETKSVQGLWKDNMWNQYPKHLMEARTELELTPIDPKPMRPLQHKKKITRSQTHLIRSNPKII